MKRFCFWLKAVEQGKAMLRLWGSASCVGTGECDVLLLLTEEMDGAEVDLNEGSQGTCMS